jgi:hypothetical protein
VLIASQHLFVPAARFDEKLGYRRFGAMSESPRREPLLLREAAVAFMCSLPLKTLKLV